MQNCYRDLFLIGNNVRIKFTHTKETFTDNKPPYPVTVLLSHSITLIGCRSIRNNKTSKTTSGLLNLSERRNKKGSLDESFLIRLIEGQWMALFSIVYSSFLSEKFRASKRILSSSFLFFFLAETDVHRNETETCFCFFLLLLS